MALIFPAGYQFLDSSGDPIAAGSVYFYANGTETVQAIYSDADLSVVASNPVELDAAGRLPTNIYGVGLYTITVDDVDSAEVWSRDEVFGWARTTGFGLSEITASILPDTDSAYALGSAVKAFSGVYADSVYVGGATVGRGSGSPESVLSAPIGSVYLRSDGDKTTAVYIKTSGSGDTGWTALDMGLTGSATYDPGNLVDGAGVTTTVTVTGAALGDYAEASFSLDLQGITLTAYVSAADTVSVRFQNETGGAIDLVEGTLRARVRQA